MRLEAVCSARYGNISAVTVNDSLGYVAVIAVLEEALAR